MKYNSYYNDTNIRDICKAVKQHDNRREQKKAIKVIARYLISLSIVGEGDILKRVPEESFYEKKKNNKFAQLHLYLNQKIPQGNHYFFVDNVISTGTTFHTANKLFDYKLIPLVYAIDDTKPQAREIIREYK